MKTVVEMYLHKTFEYYTNDGERRTARCTDYKYHAGLGKVLFTGESPRGHIVRLSEDEITFI